MLNDLENRVLQFMEANDMYLQAEVSMNRDKVEGQQMAFQSVIVLIQQLKKTGHVRRGNDYFPDDLDAMVVVNKYQPELDESLWNSRM